MWICPWPSGHGQAVGTGDARRRQYLSRAVQGAMSTSMPCPVIPSPRRISAPGTRQCRPPSRSPSPWRGPRRRRGDQRGGIAGSRRPRPERAAGHARSGRQTGRRRLPVRLRTRSDPHALRVSGPPRQA
ncbi:hypothetical protein [Streptomyces sp. CA-146814]|uniref:hypothetical protein n=1 Tax=Streptomyces sp. CA-146814 TaxID=3240053 RepID=UPI003D8CEB3E